MHKAAEYLKSVREAKNYSIEETSKKTKISPAVLRALEEGRLHNIDPVYLKGFLKLYCRFLGVDWDVFSKEYSSEIFGKEKIRKQAQIEAASASENIPKGKGFSARNNPVDSVGILFKYKKAIAAALSVIAALLLIVLLFKGCMFIIKKIPRSIPQKPQVTASNEKTTAKKFQPVKAQVENVPVKVSPSVAKDSEYKGIKLVIRAREDSHLIVKVDGRLLYQSILPKGKTATWAAKKNIELSIGNAGGLELELNDKIISPLSRHRQAIKKMVITGDGFKIY